MTLLTLLLIFVATTALSLALAAFFAWLANGMRGGRAAWIIAASFHVTYFVIGGLAVLAYMVTENASRGVREILPPAALLFLLVGPVVALARGFRKRMGMRSGKAIAATVMVLVGSGGLQYGVAVALRAAVVEAFVVPTGSMAPTIYGRHQILRCPNCGFATALAPTDHDAFGRAQPNSTAIQLPCSNCGADATVPPRSPFVSGDRILTDKTALPVRWEPIVFLEPERRAVNYVQRLVGLPGERLTIRSGDIYINDSILRKPTGSLDDLWILVHDTALVPEQDARVGWAVVNEGVPGDVWERGFTIGGVEKASTVTFNRSITSELPYNVAQAGAGRGETEVVNDVRIEMTVERFFEKSTMIASMPYQGATVRFTLVAPSRVGIAHGSSSGTAQLDAPMGRGSVVIAIRDGMASMIAPGGLVELPLAGNVAGDRPVAQGPTIEVVDGPVEFSRIRIWRDVHYTGMGSSSDIELGPDEYFVLGDNSVVSKDSRFIGPVPAGNLIGVARWRYWPPRRWHAFDSPMGD